MAKESDAKKKAAGDNKPDATNLDEQKKQLIEKAKKDGSIDQKDIFAVLPETPENAEALDALYTELAEANGH